MNEELKYQAASYEMYMNLMNSAKEMHKQLQAYKDKEDKIRKYINAHKTIFPLEYSSVDYIDYIADCEPILQILNEGSDK